MINRLREKRKKRGMALSELARRACTSRETITAIELHGQIPNGLLMMRICDVLGEDPKEIFFTTTENHDCQEDEKL